VGNSNPPTTKFSAHLDLGVPRPAILEAVMRLQFQPMPLLKRAAPFNHADWLFELKYDGFRALAIIEHGRVLNGFRKQPTTGFWISRENGQESAYNFERVVSESFCSLANRGNFMDRTVRQHVEWLEERQQALNNVLMATDTRDKANAIETEIRAVKLALEHYRAALDVEKSISAHTA